MLNQVRSKWMLIRFGAIVALVIGMAAFAVASPVAAQDDSVTIDLDELNDSGVSGIATLTADGDSTIVSIEVDGASAEEGGHPAHIHEGTCDTLDPNPAYPLPSVDADGLSDETVDVSLDDLLASEYAINLHESSTNLGVYIACGNIVGQLAQTDDDVDDSDDTATDDADETAANEDNDADDGVGGGTTPTTAPATGVGAAAAATNSALLATLGILGVTLLAGGLVLRRREVRA